MRDRMEITLNPKLSDVRHINENLWVGTVRINGWQGSFVCGFQEDGWEHVSVAPYNQRHTPTWDEMCELKSIFFGDEEECVEFHPPKSRYVNVKKNCLHIWKRKDGELMNWKLEGKGK